MRLFMSDRIAKLMDTLGYKEGDVIQHRSVTKSIERAQKKVEENNFGIRKRLLEYDDVMNSQRELIYRKRNHALAGERLKLDLNNTFHDICEDIVTGWDDNGDFEGFTLDVIRQLGMEPDISRDQFNNSKPEELIELLFASSMGFYKRKQKVLMDKVWPLIKDLYETRGETLENVVVPFTDGKKGLNVVVNLKKAFDSNGFEVINAVERTVSLMIIDDRWKEHLRNMDDLKQAVQGAVYEQKDPLLIYKFEAFKMFKVMLSELNIEIGGYLFKGNVPIRSAEEVQQAAAQRRTDMSQMRTSRQEAEASGGPGSNQQEKRPIEPIRVEKKVGRNEPCPCGSGKKYKNCHGKDDA